MKVKLTELDKLEKYLKDKGITYERIEEDSGMFGRHQIIVYDAKTDVRFWDAICHYGSYGYEQGLLEIMGEITRNSDVEGFLTAEDVIERIEENE